MKGLPRFRALMLAFLIGVLISFAIPRPAHSPIGPRTGGILVADLNPDKACGPRCVVALLRLANEVPPKYDLAKIYKLNRQHLSSGFL